MTDPELHPEDAAAMREPGEERAGRLAQEISNAIVGLYKEYFGKGPTRCRTYLHPDLVIVVLGGGYSKAEQTMFAEGRWHAVRQMRQLWQDSMQGRFVDVVEGLTGRKVDAFMSANRQDPDLAVEMFVLEPQAKKEAGAHEPAA
ncbi:MAG TPA: Na-translocating system protein MpsC family protein [Solirubrobacterales bacterium]|jgi:uncharacterized protein YbcI|nr:Na-translocating system protein MpsC family protein [Solirubrobacterales bacterium]